MNFGDKLFAAVLTGSSRNTVVVPQAPKPGRITTTYVPKTVRTKVITGVWGQK